MVPVLTLTRPEAAVTPECRHPRAVGNDGLTDAEREDYARQYRAGCGRDVSREELAAVHQWLMNKRAVGRLA
ncbi:hypothetical protein [Cellulomonas hominis]|uniref:hypothetical protein n=1 Tax=Cellulomonas hominis TaxID=156981 RepID=UPI001443E0B6|nr:hypothetical protein [Cellulomonas hominis]NKY08963.1 hypothetical protein [Cellulomonas hominis]